MTNVTAYGAVGDGVADDAPAINAAIAAGTGDVTLPRGTFRIATDINIPAACSLRGTGGWSQATTITGASLVFADGADHSSLEGVRLIGAGVGNGITARKTVHMRDVWVSGYVNGVYIGAGGSYYALLERVFAQSNTVGILLAAGVYNLTLLQPRLQQNGTGLVGLNYHNVRIIGGSVEQNTVRGIEASGTVSGPLTIEGTYFESAVGTEDIRLGAAAYLDAASLIGCRFADNTVAGYWHVNAFGVRPLSIVGCYVGASGAGGGSIQTAATTSDVVEMGSRIMGTKTINPATSYRVL